VDKLFGAVSKGDRILLILKEVEGLSVSELGKIYRITANAVKTGVFRARRRVLKALDSSLPCGMN
jgi:RNA polymerase sigma-70 factor (ECF subfamily)